MNNFDTSNELAVKSLAGKIAELCSRGNADERARSLAIGLKSITPLAMISLSAANELLDDLLSKQKEQEQ